MKVVHLIPHYQSGLGYEENHLGFAQASLGCEVTLVTSDSPSVLWANNRQSLADDQFSKHNYAENGVNIRRLKPSFEIRRQPQMLLKGLTRAIDEEAPDIIHIHNPGGLLTIQALLITRRRKIPVVIDSHICYFNLEPFTLIKRLYYKAFKYVVLPLLGSPIKRYLPLMPDSENVLEKELGISSSLMTHTTLGTDANNFRFDATARTEVRAELGIADDTVILLSVGRVTPEKDMEVLMKAFASMSTGKDVVAVVAGPIEDSYKAALLSLLPSEGRDRVKFAGFVPNDSLPRYFSAADVGVWPGVAAISIIDGMACGLPLIISNADSTRHLISGNNGAGFERGDYAALAVLLSEMVENADRRKQAGQNSRRLAEDVFAWEKVAERTIEVYREVVDHKRPSLVPIWTNVTRAF